MLLDIIRAVVQFTPTKKDDEALESLEKFIDENPEILLMLAKLGLKLLKSKSE